MADTLDVLDLDEAKTTPGIVGNLSDARLSELVTAISRRLDRACGAVVQRTITGEAHDGGSCEIRLHHPAYAFTSVTEYQGTTAVALTRETVGTAPSDGYYAEPHKPAPSLYSGTLIRRAGGSDFPFYWGRGNVAVTYTAGRYATTAAVDPIFKRAARIMLRNLLGGDEPGTVNLGEFDVPGGRFPTFAIPNAAKQLLWDEWREIPGVG